MRARKNSLCKGGGKEIAPSQWENEWEYQNPPVACRWPLHFSTPIELDGITVPKWTEKHLISNSSLLYRQGLWVDEQFLLVFLNIQGRYKHRTEDLEENLDKGKLVLQYNSIENSKNTRILLGNCVPKILDKSWNFLENRVISKNKFGFFKIFYEYFIEISRIIKRILFFYFGNSKTFKKIPRFIRNFRNAIAKQNSGIFLIFNRVALQKLICL